jgi:hypothetical protein
MLYVYLVATIVLVVSSSIVNAAEVVEVYAPATTVLKDNKSSDEGKSDSKGDNSEKGDDGGEVYYVIEGYKIYAPDRNVPILTNEIPKGSTIIRVLFPLKDEGEINGFYGYILAVKSDGQNNYSFVSNGPFTYEDFKSRCTTGTRVIILTNLSRDETVSQGGNQKKKSFLLKGCKPS